MASTRIRLFAGDFAAVNGTLSANDLTIGDVTNAYVPAGLIIMFNSNTIPAGWGLCNGTTYNKTDGSGTIVSPDLRSKFVVSVGTSYNVNSTKNNNTVTLTNAHLPSHRHNAATQGNVNHQHGSYAPGHASGRCESQGYPKGSYQRFQSTNRTRQRGVSLSAVATSGSHNHQSYYVNNTGSGQAFSVAPAYYCINFIMKL